jgi:hypothetical protein
MSDFEAALSRNDGITVVDYQPNASLKSEFDLVDSSPGKLAVQAATDTTNSSTVLTFNSVDPNASQITVYGTSGSSPADPKTSDKVYATSTKDADANVGGWQVDVTGLAAGTTYKFAGTQTVDGDESVISNPINVTTKSAAAKAATITNATLYSDAVPTGAATVNDQWLVQTSEDVTASGSYALLNLTDANGDTIQVRCDDDAAGVANTTDGITEAKCDFGTVDSSGTFTKDSTPQTHGSALLIQLLQNAEDRNTGGGATYPSTIEYPLNITSVQNVVDVNDGLPLDLANSTDKVVDSE